DGGGPRIRAGRATPRGPERARSPVAVPPVGGARTGLGRGRRVRDGDGPTPASPQPSAHRARRDRGRSGRHGSRPGPPVAAPPGTHPPDRAAERPLLGEGRGKPGGRSGPCPSSRPADG